MAQSIDRPVAGAGISFAKEGDIVPVLQMLIDGIGPDTDAADTEIIAFALIKKMEYFH
jgi:hypothetical protein